MDIIDWDSMDETGHQFTHLEYRLGRSHYICEYCAAYLIVTDVDHVAVFHSPPTIGTTLGRCLPGSPSAQNPTLKEKLDKLNQEAWDKLDPDA